ncbi:MULTISPECIES: nucleotidyltransferase domain-containing protein [unclassified Bradyrhizobium]|uniref:nucleotidyltransferase domain-containing protein n=2 Tax=unclassified Bradyrhizobium TaxID=2631580 RepID=UPI0028F04EF4|nr:MULTISPECIES: nucleotidyltransferase domain-containing protein [unclassified Bradyrhizobium]
MAHLDYSSATHCAWFFHVNSYQALQSPMTHLLHIYVFGSLCRGEISPGSDVDLLAITTGGTNELSRSMFSIYSHSKVKRIWNEGNPFAWHLHLEAKMVYSRDGSDFVQALGTPASYTKAIDDCERFLAIFRQSRSSVASDRSSIVFDLSAAFLGLRNFCSCYMLGLGVPDFSRGVALRLMGDMPPVDLAHYRILERARLLSTRGHGAPLAATEEDRALEALPLLENWMAELLQRKKDGR